MTTKPSIVCPGCHETIDLSQSEDGSGVQCPSCGTSLKAAEQPGVGTPGPEHPTD
jgi:uncharacterized paraquat-inducible protein A